MDTTKLSERELGQYITQYKGLFEKRYAAYLADNEFSKEPPSAALHLNGARDLADATFTMLQLGILHAEHEVLDADGIDAVGTILRGFKHDKVLEQYFSEWQYARVRQGWPYESNLLTLVLPLI